MKTFYILTTREKWKRVFREFRRSFCLSRVNCAVGFGRISLSNLEGVWSHIIWDTVTFGVVFHLFWTYIRFRRFLSFNRGLNGVATVSTLHTKEYPPSFHLTRVIVSWEVCRGHLRNNDLWSNVTASGGLLLPVPLPRSKVCGPCFEKTFISLFGKGLVLPSDVFYYLSLIG